MSPLFTTTTADDVDSGLSDGNDETTSSQTDVSTSDNIDYGETPAGNEISVLSAAAHRSLFDELLVGDVKGVLVSVISILL